MKRSLLFPVVVIERTHDPDKRFGYTRFETRHVWTAYKAQEELTRGEIECLRVTAPAVEDLVA